MSPAAFRPDSPTPSMNPSPSWNELVCSPAPGCSRASWAAFVYGITTTDPIAFTAAPVALLAIATLAALVPAWRASRVNAVEAMRVG